MDIKDYKEHIEKLNTKASKLYHITYELERAYNAFKLIRSGRDLTVKVFVIYDGEDGHHEEACVIERAAHHKLEEAINHTITVTKEHVEKLIKEEN